MEHGGPPEAQTTRMRQDRGQLSRLSFIIRPGVVTSLAAPRQLQLGSSSGRGARARLGERTGGRAPCAPFE